MRRDEEVEVEFFLEEGCMDLMLSNGDGNVKIVDRGDAVAEYPFEAVEAGDAGLELSPTTIILGGGTSRDPNPKDIIYILFIGKQIGFISRNYFVFVTCEKQVCIIT